MAPPDPALAYHEYLGPALFVPMARVTLAVAKPQPGERVLDVACGTGIVTSQLPALVGAAGRVTGLDISPAMLAVAKATPSSIEWREGNGTAIELPAAAFDLVTCQHGLQFFPDRAAGAREMRRMLVSGGRAVVACWQHWSAQAFIATLIRAQATHLGVPEAKVAAPFSLGDGDELRRLFADAGFSRVELQTHTIQTRFPEPEKFVRMTASAAIAVMPDQFANVNLDDLVGKISADLAADMARYREGDHLVFPMPTNLVIAVN